MHDHECMYARMSTSMHTYVRTLRQERGAAVTELPVSRTVGHRCVELGRLPDAIACAGYRVQGTSLPDATPVQGTGYRV